MTKSTASVQLNDQDFDAFKITVLPHFDQLLAENPSPAGQTLDRDKALRDMYELANGRYEINWTESGALASSAAELSLSAAVAVAAAPGKPNNNDCTLWEITVISDALNAGMYYCGVEAKSAQQAAAQIAAQLTLEQLNDLRPLLRAFRDAQDRMAIGWAVFNLLRGIGKQIGSRQLLAALETNMPWYDWIIVGTVVASQLVLLFASDGTSFVAEIVAIGILFTQLGHDVAHMCKSCGWD